MKTLINELNKMSFNDNTISMEEGYLLTYNAVSYFYKSGRYSFLQYNFEFEDILDDIFATCIKRDLFKKFQLSDDFKNGLTQNNGKKTYIKVAVQRMMIDMTNYRRTKMNISTDATVDDEDSSTDLYNTLSDSSVNIAEDVSNRLDIYRVLETLDDNKGVAVGYSPLLGYSKLNEKTILLHMLNGYTVSEISEIYKNPDTGKPVARTYISKSIKNCRRYFE